MVLIAVSLIGASCVGMIAIGWVVWKKGYTLCWVSQILSQMRCIDWWGMIKGLSHNYIRSKLERWFNLKTTNHTDTHTILTYHDGTQQYKIKWKKKSPSFIKKVTDENDNDITDEIRPYLGPNYNFHGTLLTPRDFEKRSISFHYLIPPSTTTTFEDDQIMTVDR